MLRIPITSIEQQVLIELHPFIHGNPRTHASARFTSKFFKGRFSNLVLFLSLIPYFRHTRYLRFSVVYPFAESEIQQEVKYMNPIIIYIGEKRRRGATRALRTKQNQSL
jgi:hypothetical protein